jgi:hypothetical protein
LAAAAAAAAAAEGFAGDIGGWCDCDDGGRLFDCGCDDVEGCCCCCCDPSEGVVDGGRFIVMLDGERLRARPPLRLIAVVLGGCGGPADPAECTDVVDGGRLLDVGDGPAFVMLTVSANVCGDCRRCSSDLVLLLLLLWL